MLKKRKMIVFTTTQLNAREKFNVKKNYAFH